VILCFSGHKICGPTGMGLWKESWLNKLPAYQGGGEMIKDVSLRKLLMLDCLIKAGTPNVAGGIVLELPSII
jgi:cysteine desulfurase/selenocysteine lyase